MGRDDRRRVGGTRRGRCARHATDDTSAAEPGDDVARLGSWSPVARDWLLITVSTPGGGSSTLRVYAWRNLRSLGAHYLQQSVCLLPATPRTTRTVTRLVTRLRAEGGHGEMLRISLTDSRQEAAVIDAIQRERTDEYREVVGSTQQFHEELQLERRRGRATYTELEESDADLARHQKWLAAIRARDYFDAPGGEEAAAAVASCEEALAAFESDALAAELDGRVGRQARPARGRRARRLTRRRARRGHDRAGRAARVQQLGEPRRLAAVDHPGLDAGGAQRGGQMLVDPRGTQRGELVSGESRDRLAGGRPGAVEARDGLHQHEPLGADGAGHPRGDRVRGDGPRRGERVALSQQRSRQQDRHDTVARGPERRCSARHPG